MLNTATAATASWAVDVKSSLRILGLLILRQLSLPRAVHDTCLAHCTNTACGFNTHIINTIKDASGPSGAEAEKHYLISRVGLLFRSLMMRSSYKLCSRCTAEAFAFSELTGGAAAAAQAWCQSL
eukprot:scaffold161573_cov33-Prasinocladus_malaysianus.AAC.1